MIEYIYISLWEVSPAVLGGRPTHHIVEVVGVSYGSIVGQVTTSNAWGHSEPCIIED